MPLASAAQNEGTVFFDIPNALNRQLGEMVRDDEGFIWLISNQGLCRFDGNDVKLIDYKELKLPNNTSPNHLFCYEEFLICTQENRVFLFNKISRKTTITDLGSWVSKIHKNKNGEIVFFTYSGQLWLFDKKNGLRKSIDLAAKIGFKKPVELMHCSIDENENIFFFLTNYRFGLFDGKNIKWGAGLYFDKLKYKDEELFIRMSATTSRYVGILFDNGNVNIYDKKTLLPVAVVAKKIIAAILSINDELLVITNGEAGVKNIIQNGVFKLVDNLFKERTRISGTVLINQQEKKVLLSTNNGLLEYIAERGNDAVEIQQKKIINFFSNKSIRCIYRTTDELLVGTYSGLYSCTKDSIRLVDKLIVYTMQQYNKDYLLVGLEGASGLAKYNIVSKKLIQMPSPWFTNKHFHVTALYNNNGEWICGAFNKLFNVFDSSSTFGLKPVDVGNFQLGIIRQITKIRGSLFVACQEGVFKIIGNKLVKIYPYSEKIRVSAMLEASDGIWLATHGYGIIKINDEGKVLESFGFNEGLINNFVYSLVQSNKTIIAATGGGVNVLSHENSLRPLVVKKNTLMNGVFTQEFNHSAFFYDQSNKKTILGGINGLAVIDDRSTEKNTYNSSIKLSYVKTTEKNAAYQINIFAGLKDTIEVYSTKSSVNLKFTNIGSMDGDMAFFRIKGLSDQWQNINLRDEINIYSLPPGEYTLEAKLPYANDPREWFSKTLIVIPAFYQTTSFKLGLVLVLLGVIYLAWISRTNKLKKEFKMRSMIASDLHDDIGSTLNSISVYSAIAEQQYDKNITQTKQLLDKMGIASREMIDKMSDIVWAIQPKNDEFIKVLDRIRFFAAELLSTKSIKFNFKVDEQISMLKLEMEQRKNIYLICKEAVNNAYKYAEASEITVSFKKMSNKLLMHIADNGKGFEQEKLSSQGNGLFNMRERAIEINGILNIDSDKESGTVISLVIQL